MRAKLLLIISIFLLTITECFSQERFYTSFRQNSLGFKVIEQDSNYLLISRFAEFENQNNLYFQTFSFEGDTMSSWNYAIDTASSTDLQYTNGVFQSIISGSIKGAIGGGLYPTFITFSEDYMDSLSNYAFQFTGERGGIFSVIQNLTDTTLIIAAGMQASNYTLHTSLLKVNINGEVYWKQDYYCGTDCRTLPFNLTPTHDGGYYINCNEYYHVGTQEQYEKMVVIKTDSLGEETFRYYPGDEDYHIRAGWIIQANDSNYILSYSDPLFAEYGQPWNANNTIWLVKINEEGNELWSHSLFDELPLYQDNGRNYFIKQMEKVEDGYVMAGNDGGVYGFLIKTDFDGNLLWYRFYGHPNWELNDTSSVYQRTQINGFTATSDGGFILTGIYTSTVSELYPNGTAQAIVIKVDEFGCLEEGCQLADAVVERFSNDYGLNVYPNPANDNLSVSFSKNNTGSYTTAIYNLTGQKMLYFPSSGLEKNKYDISSLKPGMYILEIAFPNGERAVRKFVKE